MSKTLIVGIVALVAGAAIGYWYCNKQTASGG